ncbi:MAG: ABC transporter substrate-binding protein [Chloroflexi bacterium]|nr:ABC transporter substrate-binding protein [Chloroflexota bacterium]MCY3937083.1 ABC transporter substrate-binding protein [Chloroflexota bacterium]
MLIRQLRILVFPLILALALAACDPFAPAETPEAEAPTPTAAPTAPPTMTPTQAPTSTPVPTPATAPTAVATATPTMTPTQAPTATPVPTSTPAPTATPMPTATPEPEAQPFEGVPGIVDPSNSEWPRQVEGLNGLVTIPAKPLRIITASVGHDEMTLALVPEERLVAVGSATKNSTYSNVALLVQDKPQISRDPETIIAQAPDVVVTSPFFPAEAVEALSKAGIAVIQTDLKHDPEARINNILFMGYIFGEEERALEFAAEVRDRYESLIAVTGTAEPRPRVLALTQYSDKLWVAGANSTEGSVIAAAGGINAAEEAGIEGNQTTSLEGVIAMNPEIIIIAQPIEFGAEDFRQSLLDNEALAEIPAVKDGKVHIVEGKHFTTLSYWNIRGAEDLARILWPDQFTEPPAASFSLAE